MKSRTSASLLIVLTFMLGCIAGAAGYYLVNFKVLARSSRNLERPAPHNIVDELAKGLDLNSQQKERLKAIVDRSREQYRALSAQMRPQFDAVREQSRQEIRLILTEDQKVRFEKIVKEIDERHQNRLHHPPQ